MAVSIQVLNESTNRTASVTVDFVYDILASEDDFPLSTNYEFYFKWTTSAKQDDGNNTAIPVYVSKDLSDLVLEGAKQARSDIATDYTSVTDMVEDYLFDMIQGHAANKHTSGVTEQSQMDIG